MASTTENEYKPLKYMAYCLTLYAELHLDLGDCQSQGWVCHKNPAYEVFALIWHPGLARQSVVDLQDAIKDLLLQFLD